MVSIKYSLYENAISSFYIAKNAFTNFYYEKSKNEKINYENIKIALVFLENSIELMLKAILSADAPTIIYNKRCKDIIEKAKKELTNQNRLEDILLGKENIKTIRYIDAVNLYLELYDKDSKIEYVLNELGNKRNAITHFGIDERDNISELYACFISTFDVIYNYLYPKLIKLDDIGHFFTDDSIINESHYGGFEFLTDTNGNFKNIIDFLEALLEDAPSYIFELRIDNEESNVDFFIATLFKLKNDKNFNTILKDSNVKIEFDDFFEHSFVRSIDLTFNRSEKDIFIPLLWQYSIYLNCSYFTTETGNLIFIINHNKNSIYHYNGSVDYTLSHNAREKEPNIEADLSNGKCEEYTLSEHNLGTILLKHIDTLKTKLSEENKNE